MKVRCLCKENVQDRVTGEDYVAGLIYPFTKERAEEVTKSRYFELVEEVEPKKEVVEKPKKSVKKSTK